jgi:hypothetical protein
MARRRPARGPLRDIITGHEMRLREGGPVMKVHVLVCGHAVTYSDDSGVYRRQCHHCRAGRPQMVDVREFGREPLAEPGQEGGPS